MAAATEHPNLDASRLRALAVPLRPEARARLHALASRERRSPRQQAAILLERALESIEAGDK